MGPQLGEGLGRRRPQCGRAILSNCHAPYSYFGIVQFKLILKYVKTKEPTRVAWGFFLFLSILLHVDFKKQVVSFQILWSRAPSCHER